MSKRYQLLFSFIILSVFGLFLYFSQQMVREAAEEKNLQEVLLQAEAPHFWVISDNHFYAEELFEDSEKFRKFEATAVGKDLRYTAIVLEALVKKALVEKPTGIILTGDVTLNGERESLIQMTAIFEPLQAAGILVFAIPGNHDIYNGWARKFQNDEKITAHQISPTLFQQSFSDGYERSVRQAPDSLSYALDLNGYRLFMLDSNIYTDRFSKSEPVTEGKLTDKTLEWLEEGLIEGQEQGQVPLFFMHHNFLAHHPKVTKGFVLNNSAEAQALIRKYQVPLAMTGHSHLQDIMQDLENPNFYEISSSAFSTAGSHIGHLTLGSNQITYEVEAFDPRPYLSEQDLQNLDLNNYPEYLNEKYRILGQEMASNLLAQLEIEDAVGIATFIGEANVRYFTGNNQLTEAEKTQIYQNPAYQAIKEQIPLLHDQVERSIADGNTPNNHFLTIHLLE